MNFITTYNSSHNLIQQVLTRNWFILWNDPVLKELVPERPRLTFKRALTIKNILAPSHLKQPNSLAMVGQEQNKKGSYRCGNTCLCCKEICHNCTIFQSFDLSESFNIKHHLTCQTQYVIYLTECVCDKQYIGRTIQKRNQRMNKHRANIKRKFLLQSLSKPAFLHHTDIDHPFTVTPIDHVPSYTANRFNVLKRHEMYWMFQL